VRHVEIKEKSKMISHIAPTDMLVGRYNNSNSFISDWCQCNAVAPWISRRLWNICRAVSGAFGVDLEAIYWRKLDRVTLSSHISATISVKLQASFSLVWIL